MPKKATGKHVGHSHSHTLLSCNLSLTGGADLARLALHCESPDIRNKASAAVPGSGDVADCGISSCGDGNGSSLVCGQGDGGGSGDGARRPGGSEVALAGSTPGPEVVRQRSDGLRGQTKHGHGCRCEHNRSHHSHISNQY